MLDVHVLLHNSNAEWEAQCRSSIEAAVCRAPFPVSVYYLDGEPGHIGRGRALGYAKGVNAFVTYVDNDDYVRPGAFAQLDAALKNNPDAVFPREVTLQNGQICDGEQRHHLAIYRRDQIIDHTQWVVCGDLAQVNAMNGKNVIEIDDTLYVHRLYQSAGRSLRRTHHDELRCARV
jgi:hypothetical protein